MINNIKLSHIGLFEGIGGFSLAARWMGWETLAWCEWNEFGQKVLKHHFPNAEGFGDITKTDFTKYANTIDILTGGFPCQPYSLAGKRKGKEDERHLWPEMLRAIREIQPTYVVGENVFGLINWNGGMVFNEVQADLEADGYEVWPYVLPACAINAPHRRDRVWFIAYSNSKRNNRVQRTQGSGNEGQQPKNNEQTGNGWPSQTERYGTSGIVTNRKSDGLQNTENIDGRKKYKQNNRNGIRSSVKPISEIRITPNSNSDGQHRCNSQYEINASKGGVYALGNIEQMGKYDTSNTCSGRVQGYRESNDKSKIQATEFIKNNTNWKSRGMDWQNFPTQPPVCGRDDGFSYELDGITFSKWRNESIKAYGNAIVPQVAYEIFKAIALQHISKNT